VSTDAGNLLKLGSDDLLMLDPGDLPGGGGGLDATGVAGGEVPTADGADGWAWAPQSGGGGPVQVATVTLTAADGEGTVGVGGAGPVLDVTVSGPCRLRVYRREAERPAGAGRRFTTAYAAAAGLLYEALFDDSGAAVGRPWLCADELYWSVDGPVDVTFRYVT